MRLTILCPTTGRDTLGRTLASVSAQVASGDEFWLISDGPVTPSLDCLWKRCGLPGRLIELSAGPSLDWGHTPRNQVLREVQDGYVLHIDDDDVLAPNALHSVRQAIAASPPGSIFFFRMQYADGRRLWKEAALLPGNVGTPMFVHPADLSYGEWKPWYGGDFNFFEETIARNPDRQLLWIADTIAFIRPVA